MNSLDATATVSEEKIIFHVQAVKARRVCLVGDFNNWNAAAHPMHPQADGTWMVELHLPRGRHYYQFLVDGEPMLDPDAMAVVRKDRSSRVSLIALS